MTTASLAKELSQQRLESAINLVTGLLDTDWAYGDASDALRSICAELVETRDDLVALDDDADPKLLNQYRLASLRTVAELTGFVGFIIRSSDVRNSFEIYHPIKVVGSALLGDKIKLIIGSEWNYNPFIYPLPSTVLLDFILVGLPASEAQNVLLLPVAGHELGHAVWRRTPILLQMTSVIRKKVTAEFSRKWKDVKEHFPPGMTPENIETDLIALEVLRKTTEIALRQCEEVFCDLLGFWIFGDAFLHAFEYLLSPDTSRRVSEFYPPNKIRAQHLAKAGVSWGSKYAPELSSVFVEPEQPKDYSARIAQEVTKDMVSLLTKEVEDLCASKGLSRPTDKGIKAAENQFRAISPAFTGQTAAEALVAAWNIRLDLNDWHVPGVVGDRKLSILNDLVLKSFEVGEWITREETLKHA
ncbi:hypothetical protein [Agrobacterium pusense]|uniref:hypothetical protein n=1 Tax=Agrobacterium pusense TaxID=648995 RepID=UPI000DDB2980|nr:hypothetical protein [Agrobacterium pusense]MCZ7930342.1 hypothetical protein [Agrobacterium pusense]